MHGSGVADLCEEDNPRLHISRRLYARRAAPVHSQPKALQTTTTKSHPSSNTSPPVEPHLTSSRIWIYW